MSIIKQLFGKSPIDVSFDDIQNYFLEEKVESDILEFKSYNTSSKYSRAEYAILETVNSFLNSSGGLVIWGAPSGERSTVNGKPVKIFKGSLCPLNVEIDKDSFIRKVTSKTVPIPTGITFHTVKNNNASEESYVYLVEVEKSPYSPHQLDGKNYFVRLDGQKHPAPHHYLEALFNKVSFPNLDGRLSLVQSLEVPNHPMGSGYHFEMIAEIQNLSPLINEESVFFSVRHNIDRFLNLAVAHKIDNVENVNFVRERPGILTCHNARPILFFGDPLVASVSLTVPRDELSKVFNFTLTFGGKTSPLKTSEYAIKIDIVMGKCVPRAWQIIKENLRLDSI